MIRPTGYILFFILAACPFIMELPLWVTGSTAALALWAVVSDRNPRAQPNRWVLRFLTLLAPALVFIQFKTLLGPEAATSLLLLLVGLKLFEVYSHRDAMIFIVLTMLVCMYYLIFRQDLISTVYMVACLVGCAYLLLRLQLPITGRGRTEINIRSLLSLEALIAVPLMVCLFLFFPRFTSPFGRYVDDPNGQSVGFSEDLRPGDLANLAISDRIAMRVEFVSGHEPAPRDLYFRGQVLEVTDGFNWKKRHQKPLRFPRRGTQEDNTANDSMAIPYTLFIEPEIGRQIFTLEATNQFEVGGVAIPFATFADQTFQFRSTPKKKYSIRAKALAGRAPTAAAPGPYDVQLPAQLFKDQPRTRALVEKFGSAAGASTATTLAKLMTYFKQGRFTYTLNTPAYENMEGFLFNGKKGFCEHFASAFAILARALGVPARVVVGFQGAEPNMYGGYYIVRDRHAHAWVEAYVDGVWRRYDPTAVVSSSRIATGLVLGGPASGSTQGSFLGATWEDLFLIADSINNKVAMMLINFDSQYQLTWLERLGFENLNRKTVWLIFGSVLGLLAAVAVLIFRLRKPRMSPMQRLRARLWQKLQGHGITIAPSDAPLHLREKIQAHEKAPDLLPLYDSYLKLHYGPPSVNRIAEIKHALKEL